MDRELNQLAESVRQELNGNLIPFWCSDSMDDQRGGVVNWVSHEGEVNRMASRGLIINTRLLWTYAAFYDFTQNEACARLAHRCYEVIKTTLWDQKYGGGYWEVDYQDHVLDASKKIYGQAFMVYAFSEYFRVFRQKKALEYAHAVFNSIEKHALDSEHGGYWEVCQQDWSICHDARLSDKDLAAPKSMNNHLHILEAYTNLYRVWPDPQVEQALRNLIELFKTKIVGKHGHMYHFFDEAWSTLTTDYTFGHDIEASWLLCEAAEVLGDPSLKESVDEVALILAQAVLDKGMNTTGGLWYAGDKGQVTGDYHDWWPQAECVVGFLNAFQLTGSTSYRDAAHSAWSFIKQYMVDEKHGEWFWRVDSQGQPVSSEPKVSAWKGPYHNGRACMEILKRLQGLNGDYLESDNEFQNTGSAPI